MADNNLDPEIIADAVQRGLERALGSSAVRNTIAAIMEESESRTSSKERLVSNARTLGRERANLEEARREGDENFRRVFVSGSNGETTPHSAGLGPSPNASVASKNLLGAARGENPYQIIPPSFGDFIGRPSAQSFAGAIMERNLEKIRQSASGTDERAAAERGYNRAEFFKNQVIPTYEAAKNFYQRVAQPIYRQMQGLSDLGATQIGGEVGGNIEIGGIGFRNPFNRAFNQGLGIAMHQLGESMRAGINRKQMAEIDNTLMGMGFNFNNNQFKVGEMALENITRFNPSIAPQQAGQLLDKTLRFGNVNEVANLTHTINDLNRISASANITVGELTNQLANYSQLAGQGGVRNSIAVARGAELVRTTPGIDPNQTLQTLMTNPMAGQQVMKLGSMPYQAASLSPQEQNQALMASISNSWKSITGKSIEETDATFLNTKQGQDAIADLQRLWGYSNYSADELVNLIDYSPQRSAIDKAESQYFSKNEKGEIIANVKGIKTRSGSWLDTPDVSGKQADESEINKILNSAGIRDPKEILKIKNDLMTEYAKQTHEGGNLRGWKLRSDWESILLKDLDARRGPNNQITSRTDFDKLVNSLDTAAQAARGLKDAQSKGGQGKAG